ncbi:MAG: TonB-dependent receptor domain-containing protein [Gemmatimonadales bacterium]
MTCRSAVFLFAGLALTPILVLAQTADVRGVVTDSATGAPLAGVHVTWSAEASSFGAAGRTDAAGRFAIAGLPLGRFTVAFSRVGYAPLRLDGIELTDGGVTLRVALAVRGVPLDPVVVSAARSEQTRLDAPASVSVIERRDIQEDGHFNPLEQIRTLPGVDLASKGLIQQTFEVRGPRGASSGALLMLTDYRYAELPSLGLNSPYLVPATREDIDRIELVRGPAAALYGPGAPRGVLHIVTRSPFESRGGVVSVSGGERSVFQGTFRYAAVVHPRVAVAVSGDYFRGNDWRWVDSLEPVNRRDYAIRRAGGEARLDWRPGPSTEIVTKGGVAEAINNIDLTGIGAVQVRHWRSAYGQAWLRHGRLFANALYNVSDAGETYNLRTGLPVVDQSRVVGAQIQHGGQLGRVDLSYGADARWTDPRTGGTIHGRYEGDDRLKETGAYTQATASLAPRLQLVAALRADYHSRLGDVVWSPRAGVVYKPGRTHALRLTYNRAFNSPPPSDLFLDVWTGPLPFPGGYGIRSEGIPPDGFTFRRDCGGLCMRSPFNPGGADLYIPADATALWPAVVAILQQQGIDLSGIPAPTGTDVGTILAARNRRTRRFDAVAPSDVRDVEPLRREITNVLELGYKAEFGGRLTLAADAWVTRVRDRVAPSLTSITPNVFYDRTSLEQYLAGYLSPTEAAQAAAAAAALPVGTVSPQESLYPFDVLFVSRQGQKYTLWGLDLAAEVPLVARFSLSGSYSWASYDSLAGALPGAPVVLSVPRRKGFIRLAYRHADAGVSAWIQARAVASFPLGPGIVATYRESGVAAYEVVDLNATYSLGPTRNVTVSADVQNVFDNAHREFAGAPALGRLAVLRVRAGF